MGGSTEFYSRPRADLLNGVENYLAELCPECHENGWKEAFDPEEECAHQFEFKRELNRIVGVILNQYKDKDQDPNG